MLLNAITENQKQRAREIYELYGEYLGIDFVETANVGCTIVTGDLRALDPTAPTGPGGVLGMANVGSDCNEVSRGTAVMDNAENWDDTFGAADVGSGKFSWFDTAMHEIGHLLGLGHTYDLAPQTIMGEEGILNLGQSPEAVFPGDHDLVHGQYLFRPESKDIDLYQVRDQPTRACSRWRRSPSGWSLASLLDSAITIYQEVRDALGADDGA